MTDRFLSFGAACVAGLCAIVASAGGAAIASEKLTAIVDSTDTPRPVPATRPEMKRLIEDVKVRRMRIPMPELSEADRQALGDRADDYETVLRQLYTPWAARNRGPRGPQSAAQRQREQDPAMTLAYAFKTE